MVDIIAEIGSNHGGSLDLAVKHIEVAKGAGATGIKFQLFRGETLDSRPKVQAALKPYELPLEWLPVLRDKAHTLDLKFIVTPFAPELALALKGCVDMVKVSAYDLLYEPLLEAVATLGVPVILSTAMATLAEVERSYFFTKHLLRVQQCPFQLVWLLHGVAAYPCETEDLNLKALARLQARFPDTYVGLSDHSIGPQAAVLAVSQGARMVEKHFRCEGVADSSPDYDVSAHDWELRELVEQVQNVEAILGTGAKAGPLPVEMPLFQTCRRSKDKPLRG